MKFKINDRVKAIENVSLRKTKNQSGTIVLLPTGNVSYGVRFDSNIGGHDLDGKLLEYGYGLYCFAESLILIEQEWDS